MDKTISPKVDILLATYNGANYIKDQLNSILYQTYKNWNLIIRDDGSTDGTIEIIQNYANLDSRIIIYTDEKGNLGVFQNFMNLISQSKSSYIMLADQDDIWMSNKVEKSLSFIRKVEDKDTPTLVFSNSILCNESMTEQFRFNYSFKEIPRLSNFLFYNAGYQGANMIFNIKLKNRLQPIFGNQIVHDFHISLVALLLGKVYHIPEPLMIYRRHSSSTTLQNISFLDRIVWLIKKRSSIYDNEMLNYLKLFVNHYYDEISKKDMMLLNKYFKIVNIKSTKLSKIFTVLFSDFSLRGSRLYLLLKVLILK